MRIRLDVAYEGTAFVGFQRQKNGRSVQGELESALGKLYGAPIRIQGAGRTDAGVHARGQVVSFDTGSGPPPEKIPLALRPFLPADLSVLRALEVRCDFRAGRDALGKTYVYRLDLRPVPDPFTRRYALWQSRPLDLAAMREAAGFLLGEHDFSAFRAAGSRVVSNRRHLRRLDLLESGGLLLLVFSADGFLYHMVRNLVGTLLDVGRGRLSPKEMTAILAAGDRGRAGPTAPAHGLTLEAVEYAPSDGGSSGLEAF